VPSLTLRLDRRDRDKLVEEVRAVVIGDLRIELRSIFDELKSLSPLNDNGPGIRVLSPAQAARGRGVSERHLYRLEAEGKVPRRRRISKRRMGYLSLALVAGPTTRLRAPE